MCLLQAQWLTRSIAFVGTSAIFAICTMIPLMVYLSYASLVGSFAVFAVLRLLQVAVIPRMLEHTQAIASTVPYEATILVVSCLVLLDSVVQLTLTPVLFTGGSCHCSWDEYSTWVRVCHWIGSAVNIGASVMASTACIGNFLSNTASFKVCSSYLSFVPRSSSTCAVSTRWTCDVQDAIWYKVPMILNFLVFLSGVALTEVASRDLFHDNKQDMGNKEVWWAMHELPIVTTVVLFVSAILLRTLQFFVNKSRKEMEAQRSREALRKDNV